MFLGVTGYPQVSHELSACQYLSLRPNLRQPNFSWRANCLSTTNRNRNLFIMFHHPGQFIINPLTWMKGILGGFPYCASPFEGDLRWGRYKLPRSSSPAPPLAECPRLQEAKLKFRPWYKTRETSCWNGRRILSFFWFLLIFFVWHFGKLSWQAKGTFLKNRQ